MHAAYTPKRTIGSLAAGAPPKPLADLPRLVLGHLRALNVDHPACGPIAMEATDYQDSFAILSPLQQQRFGRAEKVLSSEF